MKAELLVWCREQTISGARHWRDQIRNASMKNGESLRLYGLRLSELAQRAYPNDDTECIRELRHYFLSTVLRDFARQVDLTEGTALVAGTGRKLSSAAIMRLADREDERARRTRSDVHVDSHDPPIAWFNREETKHIYHTTSHTSSYSSQSVCPQWSSAAPTPFSELAEDSLPPKRWKNDDRSSGSLRGSSGQRTFTSSRRRQLQRQQPL